ncbi:conserved hypothetical protein [Candida tropicalis MYA-3404]|uniref:SH3 domain-containing protein n=1 Tax=Candida tropicalis (strain ATCC MYA-3404 / T1) TaxID=294747 RepID=C5M758_CANTT|nr:conserved hypothetical protein [Candida tropicalis MYA-3404]EER34828.1 conserved hypothetical protein [Candida tropicalis MYA-3404]KAG4408707.1 hypothetical protein JTP64_002013 [Candida tropicalis]
MVADNLKNNITQFGSSIGTHIKDGYKYTGNELTHLSYNIKDTVTFHKRDYDKDDELLQVYKHDIKQAISGLKYIVSQTHHLAKSFLPHVLSTNIKIVKNFISLIGPNSLYFKDINKYFEAFDEWQATQEIPHIHPKEMQFLNDTINEELYNYLITVENLKIELESEWEVHDESTKLRIGEMVKYLKKSLKLLSKRERHRTDQDHLHRKIEKINQKTTPLDEKEQRKLDKLQEESEQEDDKFDKLNKKCLDLLPNVVALLDEFVESVTILFLHQQIDLYQTLSKSFDHFAVFYGMLKTEDISYQQIIDQWEANSTTTRLQIESFITIIHNKNPELLDQEIDDEDKSSKYYKFWRNMNNKVIEKRHPIKPKNAQSGIFNDTLEIDPIVAFKEYNDPTANVSETYHPHKMVSREIPNPVVHPGTPPSLPPRSNISQIPVMKPAPPIATPMYSIDTDSSLDSLSLDDYEVEDESSDSSAATSITESAISSFTSYSNHETSDAKLRKLYNGCKNDIKVTPITSKDLGLGFAQVPVNQPMSLSYKLDMMQSFFNKLDIHNGEKIIKIANHDFSGLEPGDLSFKQGDKIEVLLDFQNIDTLYNSDGANWVVGLSRVDENNYRVGFVPNNYIE